MLVAPKYAKRLNPRFVEQFKDQPVPWGPLGYVIFKRTYARRTDTGYTEEWWQTCARCVNGLIEIGAIYTHEEAEQLFWYMFMLKGTPAGRPLWQLGTDTVRRLGGDSLNNCFAAQTEVLTSNGIAQIKDIIGKTVEVQVFNGTGLEWIETEFKSYCRQKLFIVNFDNETTIWCTADHEWLIYKDNISLKKIDRVKTTDLLLHKVPIVINNEIKSVGVNSVKSYGHIQEVFCCVIPEYHNFTLGNGIITGQCWTINVNEPVDPFTFAFNELMLGGGVGFNITPESVYEIPIVKHSVKIERVDDYDSDYIVTDNREGWVLLLDKVLRAFFYTGKNLRYDTRCIRPKGRSIKGFGGISSGPEELVKGIAQIAKILNSKVGRKLTPTNCLDIMNIIGSVVVAGNIRRCMPNTTIIHTQWGLQRIDEIEVGDNVQTLNGYKKVTNVFKQGVQKLITVVLSNNRKIRCTSNHKFAIVTDLYGEIDWVEASKLIEGDTLLINCQPCEGEDKVDIDKAYFYGNFAGDGSCYLRPKTSESGSGGTVTFTLTNDTDGYKICNKLNLYLKQINLEGICDTGQGNSLYFRIYNTDFTHEMIKHKIPKHCPIIPDWLYTSSIEARCAYLAGLCDADGTPKVYNLCSSKYTQLLLQVQKIATSLGIDTYIATRPDRVSKQTGKIYDNENMLIVNGFVSRKNAYRLINPYMVKQFPYKTEAKYDAYLPFEFVQDAYENKHITKSELNKLTSPIKREKGPRNVIHKQLIELDPIWKQVTPIQVKEVIDFDEEEETYDIEVEGEHCYFAEGILVHNSAEIGIGSADDPEFLSAKDWSRRIIPPYRQMANLTVATPDVSLLPEDYWRGYEGNGEAYGAFNQELCRKYGRLVDGEDYRPDYGIIACNPCIVGETWIQTNEGPRQVTNLIGKKFVAVNDGEHYYSTDEGFFCTGIREVFELMTEHGYSLILTKDHQLEHFEHGWKELSELQVGDKIVLQQQFNLEWGGAGSYIIGFQDANRHILSIPRDIETFSSNYYLGFIIGLVHSYGKTTIDKINITCYNAEMVQRMLLRLGVMSMVTGDGLYFDKKDYDLCIIYRNYEKRNKYTDRILSIESLGRRLVYDCQIPEANRFDANGINAHNCGEECMESHEACNLAEQYLPNIVDVSEMGKVAELLFKGHKAISCLPYWHPKTNEVVQRNRRIGIGITGVLQAPHLNDAETLDAVYSYLEEVDVKISREMNVNRSIKISTVKPSGSLSLLAGVSPGGHAEFAEYYIRRVTFAVDDPIVKVAVDSGHNMEPKLNIDGSRDLNMMVIDFPIQSRGGIIASRYPALQQLKDHEHLQTYWSDGAVSKTIYMQREEIPIVREWLKENYHDTVKTISVSLHKEHGFKQAPYEEITEAQYLELSSKVIPIDSINDTGLYELVETQECGTGGCPIK